MQTRGLNGVAKDGPGQCARADQDGALEFASAVRSLGASPVEQQRIQARWADDIAAVKERAEPERSDRAYPDAAPSSPKAALRSISCVRSTASATSFIDLRASMLVLRMR